MTINPKFKIGQQVFYLHNGFASNKIATISALISKPFGEDKEDQFSISYRLLKTDITRLEGELFPTMEDLMSDTLMRFNGGKKYQLDLEALAKAFS